MSHRAFFERAKRGVCPECGKRGLGEPKTVMPFGNPRLVRECRYCTHEVDVAGAKLSPEDHNRLHD